MPRYVKVAGRSDLLVANPHALNSDPPRFAGQRRRPGPVEDPAGLIDFYEPVEEVLLWNDHLHTAIAKGELKQIGDRVEAKNVDDAIRKMGVVKAKSPKGGE